MNDTNEKHQVKHGLVQFSPGQPMQLQPEENELGVSLSQDQQTWADAIGTTLRAYIDAAHKLLDGKYANIKDQAPPHLAKPSSVLAIRCEDGIIIRYDSEKKRKGNRTATAFVCWVFK